MGVGPALCTPASFPNRLASHMPRAPFLSSLHMGHLRWGVLAVTVSIWSLCWVCTCNI